MIEIICHGKRIDNGEWVEGHYYKRTITGATEHIGHVIQPEFDTPYEEVWYEVIPESITRYIGLEDKNSKRIFEGDVVRHYNVMADPKKFDVGKIWWCNKECCFKRTTLEQPYLYDQGSILVGEECVYEVIGNIYDNPELMGVD